MPNGHDKNWIRLCGAIDGFRVRYGRWPTRVRMFPVVISEFRDYLFSPEDFRRIMEKVDLVPDAAAPLIAEDDIGASYNYGMEGFPHERPTPRAEEWLGVEPKPENWWWAGSGDTGTRSGRHPQNDKKIMNSETDPRVYFAAERTLLAWVRTGIGVMAFGFVVARFGLFVRLIRSEGTAPGHGLSPYLGAALVLLGVLATAAGATQYQRFCRKLRPEDLPSPQAPHWPLALAWTLVGLGAVLVINLLV